jgi:Type VII secretion system ESX-1, transport TM domain B
MPPSRVAVIRSMAAPDAPTGALAIVTDTGMRYPVPDENSLQYLGFQANQAIPVPDRLVAQLPLGPTLSADTARQAAASGGTGR